MRIKVIEVEAFNKFYTLFVCSIMTFYVPSVECVSTYTGLRVRSSGGLDHDPGGPWGEKGSEPSSQPQRLPWKM
jgi:hypothetical protein